MRSLLFIALILFAFGAKAQSFISLEDTLSATDNITQSDLTLPALLDNPASSDVDLRWRFAEITVPGTWLVQMCDPTACFGPSVTQNDFALVPGTTTHVHGGTLALHFLPMGEAGTGKVVVKVMEVADTTQFEELVFIGTITGPTSTGGLKGGTISFFPNPARNVFEVAGLNPEAGLSLRAMDITGSEVRLPEIGEGRYDISKWNEGIYIIQILGPDKEVRAAHQLMKR